MKYVLHELSEFIGGGMIRFISSIFLALIIGGCSPESKSQETPSSTPNPAYTDNPTLSVKATVPTPTREPGDSFRFVTSGNINFFVWGADSNQVFYNKLVVDSEVERWEYNLENGESSIFGDMLPPIEEPQNDPTPPVIPYPGSYFEYSPSGERGLFYVLLYPTATPRPFIGEGSFYSDFGPVELWYWEGGKSHKIGGIKNCIENILWSSDENKLVIDARPIQGCDESPLAWLVDLETNSIDALVPGGYEGLFKNVGFSPDDQHLLYIINNNLILIDVNTLEVKELETPDLEFIMGIYLNDNTILAIYTQDIQSGSPDILVLFNIETLEFTPLLENSPATLQGRSVSDMLISPDKKWVAFTIGEFPWEIEGLWLLKLPE